MMKYGTLLYTTASLLVISSSVYAGLEKETKETCEKLGYKTPAAECEKTGAIPLLCPFYDVTEANGTLSLCVTKSCRGYPLWKEGNTYYHFNTAGDIVPAVPAEGKIEDYVATFKECESGIGKDKRTYYRIETCKTTAINGVVPVYQSDICDVGCDRINKYPFDTHPGNLAGTVEECMDKDGTYYGYTKCNEGWDPDGHGRCNLSSCDIRVYPYTSDPNIEEDRGTVSTCKIGMNAYYRYVDQVGNNGELPCTQKGNNFVLRKGVCAKKCEINTSSCKSENKGTYTDWSCSFSTTKCRIGDLATINGNVVGVIVHLKTNETDKTLVIPDKTLGFSGAVWGKNAAEVVNVPGIPDLSCTGDAKTSMIGKANTAAMEQFAATQNWSPLNNYYPGAAYCLNYAPDICSGYAFCRQGEWYWPALGELGYMYDNRYVLYNMLDSARLYDAQFWASSEACRLRFEKGNREGSGKNANHYIRPFLAF